MVHTRVPSKGWLALLAGRLCQLWLAWVRGGAVVQVACGGCKPMVLMMAAVVEAAAVAPPWCCVRPPWSRRRRPGWPRSAPAPASGASCPRCSRRPRSGCQVANKPPTGMILPLARSGPPEPGDMWQFTWAWALSGPTPQRKQPGWPETLDMARITGIRRPGAGRKGTGV